MDEPSSIILASIRDRRGRPHRSNPRGRQSIGGAPQARKQRVWFMEPPQHRPGLQIDRFEGSQSIPLDRIDGPRATPPAASVRCSATTPTVPPRRLLCSAPAAEPCTPPKLTAAPIRPLHRSDSYRRAGAGRIGLVWRQGVTGANRNAPAATPPTPAHQTKLLTPLPSVAPRAGQP